MRGPEIRPENHQDIYEFYKRTVPRERLVHSVHRLASWVYRPHVEFADEAEAQIADSIDRHERVIVTSNHLNIADQFLVSALIRQLEVLQPLEGHTFVLAKASYFSKRYLRPGLDATGTLPVFRPQEVGPNVRLQAEATKSLIDATTARIIKGWNVFMFPEGTRNRGNPRSIGRIQGGVGRIAAGASSEVGVSILPVGLWYGENDDQHLRSPEVYINNPIGGPFESKRAVLGALRPALQESIDRAIESDR